MHDFESYFDSEDDEEEQIDGALLPEMAQHKEGYYKEKFGFASVDKLSVTGSVELYELLVFWLLGISLLSYRPVMWLP